jgi:hypothetical protein
MLALGSRVRRFRMVSLPPPRPRAAARRRRCDSRAG